MVDRDHVIRFTCWLAAGIFALLAGLLVPSRDADLAAFCLSALSFLFGVWLFWFHGGKRITAAGIWGFGFALFVGFAGLYNVLTPTWSARGLTAALTVAYFGQVFMWGLFWSQPASEASQQRWRADPIVLRWGIVTSSVVLILSCLAAGRFPPDTPFLEASAFVSVVLLSASLLLHRGGALGAWRLILSASAFLIYAVFVFSGFGRLLLGTLGLALSVILSKQFPGRVLKAVILLASVPALLIFARTRVEFTASLNPDQSSSTTGFESVVGVLSSFSELLSRREEIPLGHGSTFWAAGVSMVPRGLWPEKPDGFGAVLVPYLSPGLVGTGHSDAALSHGEWLFDFGVAGLVVMVPVLGWVVRMTDRWLQTVNSRAISTRRRLIALAAATILASGLPDLLWGGSFTYVSRAAPRLLILGVLLIGSRFDLGRTQVEHAHRVEETTPRHPALSS
jgi:hypothetical protein